jgi:hypothetical protein
MRSWETGSSAKAAAAGKGKELGRGQFLSTTSPSQFTMLVGRGSGSREGDLLCSCTLGQNPLCTGHMTLHPFLLGLAGRIHYQLVSLPKCSMERG